MIIFKPTITLLFAFFPPLSDFLSSHLFTSLRRFEPQRIGGSVAAAVTC